jgi:hypothetical protein
MRMLATLLLLAACSAGAGNQVANGGAPKAPPAAPPPDRCAGGGDEEHCVDFGAAERMRGTWITGFEVSNFWAEGEQGADGPGRPLTWLTFAAASPPDPALFAQRDRIGGPAAIRIEFIGRRARRPGHYGHLGGAEHLVIVDRIVSTEFLGPVRP